ncbi:MAG: OmpA family protein [Sphingomonadales bacterium]|nr:OmpA family protein [Sphingomonadales bacterium]
MSSHRLALILAGAFATAVIALGGELAHGPKVVAGFEAQARAALDRAGGSAIAITFRTPQGWLTRHPELSGGDSLDPAVRARAAAAVAALPGIGGVRWALSRNLAVAAENTAAEDAPLHCQGDVEGILKARSIRFGEASAAIDPASSELLDEVAGALAPCVGSIIAVTGHTDAAGDEAANLALSIQRAEAVRAALIGRGIPADGLRAAGLGSKKPVPGLDPRDPANRRIEFSVIATVPLRPTPVDTPGAG